MEVVIVAQIQSSSNALGSEKQRQIKYASTFKVCMQSSGEDWLIKYASTFKVCMQSSGEDWLINAY